MIIGASIIYIIIFFIISIFLSYVLYNKKEGLVDVPKYIVIILFFLRFLTFFVLFCLLLKPYLIQKDKIIDQPLLVFLQDNSSSIVLNKDSTYFRVNYKSYLDSLSKLKNVNIDVISFDDQVRDKVDFTGYSTNISSAIDDISNIYSNLNVGGYILASDGIYNQGFNALYSNVVLNAPLYSVLLGDTTHYKDAFIKSVRSNKITHLGNQSPVDVLICAEKMKGSDMLFEVFDNNKDPKHVQPIYSQNIKSTNNQYSHKIQFFLSPDDVGVQSYFARIKSQEFEKNISNNSKSFFIDVIDDRKKILLLFTSPHPDISAIVESLESFDQYELDTYWYSKDNMESFDHSNLEDYSLIIAHQLSGSGQLLDLSLHTQTPVWFIMGSGSDLNQFNQMQDFVKFQNKTHSFETVNTTLNRDFSYFSLNDSLVEFLSFSSPFITPFADFEISSLSETLLYKKIGSINTQKPILFFTENESKSAFLLGEGIWRWRLNNMYLNKNHRHFNSLINKIIQTLILDEDKSRFHVSYEPLQRSNNSIVFNAELYNKNFELTNIYDVTFNVIDSLGQSYTYQFNTLENYYFLSIDLPEGKYNFIANTEIGNEVFVEEGSFIVADFNLETRELVSDELFLSNLASKYNGKLISRDSIGELISDITNPNNFKPRTYLNYSYKSLINFQTLLVFILVSLFAEWFIRRRYLNY
ncbi:MAG: hypothetical protein CMD26_02030 [Flavobacteriales bacterium]|nr:hypothetical protein [Flavobacteriales bacterium]